MIQQNLINISGQQYRQGNKIGSGGYAVIYQGENIHSHEKVAIRIAHEMTEDEYNIHQILINQKKQFLIDIKGLEFKEEQGTIVIIMELGKEDFHQFMEKNEFKQLTNLDKNLVFHQMVSAVNELHQLEYFHRDLKTENFIIIENFNKNCPNIKLIDFGLCKHLNNKNRLTQQAGTILFMAPEVISSDQYNQTSDIWSLGCIYFEIMTKQSFLQGTTYQGLINSLQTIQQNQIDQKIDQLQQMNLEEKNLLKGMMQKDPSLRFNLNKILQQLDGITKRNCQQPFNNFPQKPIQPQQFIQWNPLKQQQLSAVRLQTQMKNCIEQKYQEKLQEVIIQFKMEIEEQQYQQILKKQKELEQQNLQVQSRLEKEIKQEYDLKIQQFLQDKEKLKELQIEYELEAQNRLNQLQMQQKQEFQKNIDSFQQQIKNFFQIQLDMKIKEKETQIYAQIDFEQKQIFEQKLKEIKDQKLKVENEQKQQQFQSKKQSRIHQITCYNELLSKNQKIIVEKQKILKKFEHTNQFQVSSISSKVYDLLQDYEQDLQKSNQILLDLKNINDFTQQNFLDQLENQYQEKITQQTINLIQNIKEIDQEIQNFNQFSQQKKNTKQNQEEEIQLERLRELKQNLEQQLSFLRDQFNKMRQQANILLQSSQEYETVQLIQKSKKEIESLDQQELELYLIQKQYEQMKYLDLLMQEECLNQLSQQCRDIEKQCQNQEKILNNINQQFLQEEQIVLQQFDELLNWAKTQLNFQKSKFDSFRKELQNLQFQQIDDCENKLFEIQNIIQKINFQRQQFCIKKQKSTFDLIKQKFEEFNILYNITMRIAEEQREANKCKQQFDEVLGQLQDLILHYKFQIETFDHRTKNLRVNQEIQLQVEKQLNILSEEFKNYVEKCKGFEKLSKFTAKDYQLNELQQSLNEEQQFYQESDKKFKHLFQQAQTTQLKIEMIQQSENKKWQQFNDLCGKIYQFQKQSKNYQYPKDIAFCEKFKKIADLKKLLEKYQNHFLQCWNYYQINDEICKKQLGEVEKNINQFQDKKIQNIKYIEKIKKDADENFQKLAKFLQRISNTQEELKSLLNNTEFYNQKLKQLINYDQISKVKMKIFIKIKQIK